MIIGLDAGLWVSGAVLVTCIVVAAVACLLPEPEVDCGICGGTRHWNGRPCPRCNASAEA